MKQIKFGDTFVNIGSKGNFFLSKEKTEIKDYEYGYVNSNVSVKANEEAEIKENQIMPCGDFLIFDNIKKKDNGLEIKYNFDRYPLTLKEDITFIKGLNVISQKNILKNNGKKIRINKLSCTNVLGIGKGGTKWFENDNRFIVYYPVNRWQGEGQWQKKTLRELGMYPTSNHVWEQCSFKIQSFGSYSTAQHYPLMIIEDNEKGEAWFFEYEGATSWYIELSSFEGFNSDSLSVSIGCCDEKLGWEYYLKKGEEYQTGRAIYGVVKGDFSDAIKELVKYKRQTNLSDKGIKIAFNDYMNCNWALPTEKKLKGLIDKASKVGAEIFCIDDGWANQGEWKPLDELFPKMRFKGIIDYIKSKGMIPGVWFEFETAGKFWKKKYLRKRQGEIISDYRPKLDLTNKKAREELIKRIDYVYSLGVRYIKNDHNNDEKIGSNKGKESFVEGIIKNTSAFYEFIKAIKKRYPDLRIENCAGGAGREENGTLKYFDLQSVSDQENYLLNPSIIVGQSACILPEKSGIWSYPYPLLFKDRESGVIPDSEKKSYNDGRQTVFNMVNSMMGYMYLSGKIDVADKYNIELIKESIKVYKGYKDTIKDRYPFYPVGLKGILDRNFNAYGLISEDKSNVIMALWGLNEKDFSIDLKNSGFKKATKLYPSIDNGKVTLNNGTLQVNFDEKNSAMLVKIEK